MIRDLQDSLRKRHPDSVASLIRAATVSDSVQAERRQQEQQVAAMRQELDDIKEQHEKRLRSLRQEHERIKVQYEKAKEELEHAKGGDSGASAVQGGGLGGLTKGSSSASNTVKTLSQALNKIRLVCLKYISPLYIHCSQTQSYFGIQGFGRRTRT